MFDADIIFSGRPENLTAAELSNSMSVQGVQAPPPGSAGSAGQGYQPPIQVNPYILAILHALPGGEVYMELRMALMRHSSSFGLKNTCWRGQDICMQWLGRNLG